MPAERKQRSETRLFDQPVFSLDEFAERQGKKGDLQAAWNQLKYHMVKGRVKKIIRGVYASVPSGLDPGSYQPDRYWVAAVTRPDGIFCHHSALELMGAGHSTWNECTLFCRSRRPPIQLGEVSVRFLSPPGCLESRNWIGIGTRQVDRKGRMLRITGPERTLIDGFRQPHRVGGLEELIHCASGFSVLDPDLLESLLMRYDQQVLWAAVGWFLERYQDRFFVPEKKLKRFEKRTPPRPRYLHRNQRGGDLIRRWNLIVPEALVGERRNRHGEP